MNTDRNLLFGVLALQTDLIDSSQFADACAAWAARKTAPLADILIERGWITAADKADVERLMERKLKRHGGDLQATIDAVADAGVREAMLTVEDTELRRTMARLSSVSGHILVDPLAKPSESHTRYTLSRLHGQGGLGGRVHSRPKLRSQGDADQPNIDIIGLRDDRHRGRRDRGAGDRPCPS